MLRLVLLLAAAPPVFTVTGTAQREHRTTPCMGGVRITEDMETLETTVLATQDFTVFSGADHRSVVARFKTNSRGSFSTTLPRGSYCVVLGKREPAIEQPPRDPEVPAPPADCIPNPQPPCDAQWVVTDRPLVGVRVTLHSSNQCAQPWANPCWRGPMPP